MTLGALSEDTTALGEIEVSRGLEMMRHWDSSLTPLDGAPEGIRQGRQARTRVRAYARFQIK